MEKIIFIVVCNNVGVCLRAKPAGLVLNVVYGEESEKHAVIELKWRSMWVFAAKQILDIIYFMLKG